MTSNFNLGKDAWWNSFSGPFKALHSINPPRLKFILEEVSSHFGSAKQLTDISVLDAGCGGGIVSLPLARKGMRVLGIDTSDQAIDAAIYKSKALPNVKYLATDLENFASGTQDKFDLITCMDVIEHVEDLHSFASKLRGLVNPGGMIVISTINKTIKAAVGAIVLGEYVLGIVPVGTHQYSKLVQPGLLASVFAEGGFSFRSIRGIEYSFLNGCWKLGNDTSINYVASITKSLLS